MAASQHVEMEAAKFLQKLIQESKDEPAKLAMKLYVICQHMKMSGKEQSLPYQVISRAMETVINQNGIDIEALKSSRLPMTGGTQMADSAVERSVDKDKLHNQSSVGPSDMSFSAWHAGSSGKIKDDVYGGSSQGIGVLKESKACFPENEMGRLEAIVLNRPPAGPSRVESVGHDAYQGSASQRSGKSFDHESPSSLDTRSANSQERRDTAKPGKQGRRKDNKKASGKRKRADSSTSAMEEQNDNPQPLDGPGIGSNMMKGKLMNKGDAQGSFTLKAVVHNPVQNSGHVNHLPSFSGGLGSIFRTKQENQSLIKRPGDTTKTSNSMGWASTPRYPEEAEVSSPHGTLGLPKGGMQLSRHEILSSGGWNQNKVGLQTENSQGSRFPLNIVYSSSTAETSMSQLAAQSPGTSKEAGQSSEGTILCKVGNFWEQQKVPHSAQQIGEESLGNETELGVPGRSFGPVNSNTSHGNTATSGGMPGAFSSYPIVRPGSSAPMPFNSSFDSHDLASKMCKERNVEASSRSQLLQKSNDMIATDMPMKSPAVEFASAKISIHSELRKPGFIKDAMQSVSEKGLDAPFCSSSRREEAISGGRVLEQDQGALNTVTNSSKMVQRCETNSDMEMSMARGGVSRDTGKSLMSQPPAFSGMPFKEQQLKQLRAQCLVFLAFRNGMVPRKLHLEIAIGESYPKEGGSVDGARRELIDHRGKESSLMGPSNSIEVGVRSGRTNDIKEAEKVIPGSSSTGSLIDTDSLSKDTENTKKIEKQNCPPTDQSLLTEDSKKILFATRKPEDEMQTQGTAESQVGVATTLEPESTMNHSSISSENIQDKDDPDNGHQQVGRGDRIWTGISCHHEATEGTIGTSLFQHEQFLEREENHLNQSQTYGDRDRVNKLFTVETSVMQARRYADKYPSTFPLREQNRLSGKGVEPHMPMPPKDVNPLTMNALQGGKHSAKAEPIVFNSFANASVVGGNCGSDDQRGSEIQKQIASDGCKMVTLSGDPITMLEKSSVEEEDEKSLSLETPPSPKYTTSEKWIMDRQKRKLLEEEKWALKQKKTEEKITASFDKLKETVSSSEDIPAKTRSVIELKKLQLLKLQRRLRSDFLHDFFKPITSDMERLRAFKKHKHGRRIKQIEKFEQKMKEERQKRIRERQKEFFSEIEVHKERMDDWFKIKRERWKGFNKYVKEFHKRKERIHREKIDRIQREKINLLKINDVEGYLRMVQDAKSDRVKQLLKETEKYLQKLGAKLQEAKAMTRCFETDMDESRSANVVEKKEVAIENEDETDQAQHYLESNEKYYLMAHSIKESITEQPTSLQGGKLREYQMNGLRWLVSLYNNHLNGILADEMGLGKTVQVISLICYLMETKNDRGPFLVVVPSSVLPGWESEINFWAPGISKIAYAGPPEERRRLFKERIAQGKFNVLLTTYEYLMNKHDRPRLSKIHWHYVIIDEGHRIKNASCKLNADLKHYQSSHRLLLTGTPLQNNLEELWALLNFLLPNIFNSSEDFSQWFNKPFESSGDNSPDEALLSEEENLLIINRLHQVLRPFVLRRLKHKVENELPEKIERLVRCEASAYQKLLMKRVEDNLGSIGSSKVRSVHNSVMELRNICNHPYLSQLHAEEVDTLIPKHYLPPVVRLCGKLEMLDRLLPKLKATDHRVLFFSTMTRLLDVMEEYLHWKRYSYLRLDGHTSGNERGALIEEFNRPDSPAFIFLLSIRAGGVGVNLQAADTVIIFDTDWNPQVDLQAQARAHRIGQKRDVLVLRLETVQTVEEQVRASAEHKLGVANQSITAGFFDNNTSAEDRREYLESLLRESKKEEDAPVLDDDALNDILARSESELDVFESVDRQRREEEMAAWQKLVLGQDKDSLEPLPPLSPRLVTDEDLKAFYQAMQIYEVSNVGLKRKSENLGGLDTQQYGRGKRAREVRSYEDKWTEEEFEKMCQVDSPESSIRKEETVSKSMAMGASDSKVGNMDPPPSAPLLSTEQSQLPGKELPPTSRRGRGRPKRAAAAEAGTSLYAGVVPAPSETVNKLDMGSHGEISPGLTPTPSNGSSPGSVTIKDLGGTTQHEFSSGAATGSFVTTPVPSVPIQAKGQNGKPQSSSESSRRRAKKQSSGSPAVGPETNPAQKMPTERGISSDSSPASLVHDNQKVVRPSGTLNAPIDVSPESSSISRISKERGIMSDSSRKSAFATQKLVDRPHSTSNAPTIVSFEVNPITGLPKVVELVPVRTTMPSFSQAKYMRVGPSLDKRETEKVPISESKSAPIETSSTPKTSSVESNKKEGVKVSMLPAGKDSNVSHSSTPVMSALAQDLSERRSHRMGTLDKQKASGKPEPVSAQTPQKAGYSLDASRTVPTSGSVPERAVYLDLPKVKPVEFVAGQDNIPYGNASDMCFQNMKDEQHSVPAPLHHMKSSADKGKSKSPVPVKWGTKRKDLGVSDIKQAAVAIKSSNVVVPSVHAPTVGSQVAEGNRSSMKAVTMKDKPDNDSKKVGNVIDDKGQSLAPVIISDQRLDSTEKLVISTQSKLPADTSTLQNCAISMDKSFECAEANTVRNFTSEQFCEAPLPNVVSCQEPNSDQRSAQEKQHLTCSPIAEKTTSSVDNTTTCVKPKEVESKKDGHSHVSKLILSKKPKLTEKSNLPGQSVQQPDTSTLQENAVISMENSSICMGSNARSYDSTEKPFKAAPPDIVCGQEPNSNEKSSNYKLSTLPSVYEGGAASSLEGSSTKSMKTKSSPNDGSSLSEMPDLPSNDLPVSPSGQLTQSLQQIPDSSGTLGVDGCSVGSINLENTDDGKQLEGTIVCQGEAQRHDIAQSILSRSGQVSRPNERVPVPPTNDGSSLLGDSEVPNLADTTPTEFASSQLSQTGDKILNRGSNGTADTDHVNPVRADDAIREGATVLCPGEIKHDTDPSMPLPRSGQDPLFDEQLSDPPSTQDAYGDSVGSANSEHPVNENYSYKSNETLGQIEVKPERADDVKKPEGPTVLCQSETKHDTALPISGSGEVPLLDEQVSDLPSTRDAQADPDGSANSEDPGAENYSEVYDVTDGQIEVKPEHVHDSKKLEGTTVLCEDETKQDTAPSMCRSSEVPPVDDQVSDTPGTHDAHDYPDGPANSENPGTEDCFKKSDTAHGQIEIKPEHADDVKKPEGTTLHCLGEVQYKDDPAPSMFATGHDLQLDVRDVDTCTPHYTSTESEGYSKHCNSTVNCQSKALELSSTAPPEFTSSQILQTDLQASCPSGTHVAGSDYVVSANSEAPGRDETEGHESTALPSQSEETEVPDTLRIVLSTQISNSDQDNPSSYISGTGEDQNSMICEKAELSGLDDSMGMHKIFVTDQTAIVASGGDSSGDKLDRPSQSVGEIDGIIQDPGDVKKADNDEVISSEALPGPSHTPIVLHVVPSDEDKMVIKTSEAVNTINGAVILGPVSSEDADGRKEGTVSTELTYVGDSHGDEWGLKAPSVESGNIGVPFEEDESVRDTSEANGKTNGAVCQGPIYSEKPDRGGDPLIVPVELTSVQDSPGDRRVLKASFVEDDNKGVPIELSSGQDSPGDRRDLEASSVDGDSKGVPSDEKKLAMDTSEGNGNKINEAVNQGPVYSKEADEGGDHSDIVPPPIELTSSPEFCGDKMDPEASSVNGKTKRVPFDDEDGYVRDASEANDKINEAVSQDLVYFEKADESGADPRILPAEFKSGLDSRGEKLDPEASSAESGIERFPFDDKEKLVGDASEANYNINEDVSDDPVYLEKADEVGDHPGTVQTELTSGLGKYSDKLDLEAYSVERENASVPVDDRDKLIGDASGANAKIGEAVSHDPVYSENADEGRDHTSIVPTQLTSGQDSHGDKLDLDHEASSVDRENEGLPFDEKEIVGDSSGDNDIMDEAFRQDPMCSEKIDQSGDHPSIVPIQLTFHQDSHGDKLDRETSSAEGDNNGVPSDEQKLVGDTSVDNDIIDEAVTQGTGCSEKVAEVGRHPCIVLTQITSEQGSHGDKQDLEVSCVQVVNMRVPSDEKELFSDTTEANETVTETVNHGPVSNKEVEDHHPGIVPGGLASGEDIHHDEVNLETPYVEDENKGYLVLEYMQPVAAISCSLDTLPENLCEIQTPAADQISAGKCDRNFGEVHKSESDNSQLVSPDPGEDHDGAALDVSLVSSVKENDGNQSSEQVDISSLSLPSGEEEKKDSMPENISVGSSIVPAVPDDEAE